VELRRLLPAAQLEGRQVVVAVEHEVGAPVAVDEAAHVEHGCAREVAGAEHGDASAGKVLGCVAERVDAVGGRMSPRSWSRQYSSSVSLK
jgi:hypothetical protein